MMRMRSWDHHEFAFADSWDRERLSCSMARAINRIVRWSCLEDTTNDEIQEMLVVTEAMVSKMTEVFSRLGSLSSRIGIQERSDRDRGTRCRLALGNWLMRIWKKNRQN